MVGDGIIAAAGGERAFGDGILAAAGGRKGVWDRFCCGTSGDFMTARAAERLAGSLLEVPAVALRQKGRGEGEKLV